MYEAAAWEEGEDSPEERGDWRALKVCSKNRDEILRVRWHALIAQDRDRCGRGRDLVPIKGGSVACRREEENLMREAGETFCLVFCGMAEGFGQTESLLGANRGPKTFGQRLGWPLMVGEGTNGKVAHVLPRLSASSGRSSVRKRCRSGGQKIARRSFGPLVETSIFPDMSSGDLIVLPNVSISKS